MPSAPRRTEEVMNPALLTTNSDPFQATEESRSRVSKGLRAQLAPSGLARIVPRSPTATNRDPLQAMSRRVWSLPENRAVQAEPSGLVRITPELPTATKVPPPYATPFNRFPCGNGLDQSHSVQTCPDAMAPVSKSPSARDESLVKDLDIESLLGGWLETTIIEPVSHNS